MERLKIWEGDIPGNSTKRKEDVMEIQAHREPNATLDMIQWVSAIKDNTYKDKKKIIDTYTATWVRKTDDAYNETFEDVPYLIPYIAESSQKAVIIVPGGGFCYKSMENEGTDVAKQLQKNGINAFVLWYRSNPYYQPIPLMDMQRAIRYVRYHAKNYGYDEDKISAIGFSAGGALVGLFANVFHGKENMALKYQKDKIDQMDDSLNAISLIYPSLNYRNHIPMMFASFPSEDVRNEEKRMELIEIYDAVKQMSCVGIPHFLSYGTKDDLISIPIIKEYREILKKTNTNYLEVLVEGAGHGYGASIGQEYGYWLDRFIDWIKKDI